MEITHLSYQIIPNIVFIFAILGIIIIILRHLPQAREQAEQQEQEAAHVKLAQKGLPAEAFSRITRTLKFWSKKLWNFALEAKDLKPSALSGYKIKKIFGSKTTGPKKEPAPVTTQEIRDEKYYLDQIKLQPKNLSNYDSLGKYYLERDNFSEAKDIYAYLVDHAPANSDYQARLAHCYYKEKNFEQAASHYQKSLALDSTQPNRYYNLGLALDSKGDWQGAASAFRQAITLEPNNSKYYMGLSNASSKMGKKEEARKILEEALIIDPENTSIKTRLEQLA